jgi:hypothetical protein
VNPGDTISTDFGVVDRGHIDTSDDLWSRSAELVLQGHYRLGLQAVAGASYTYAHSWGTTGVFGLVPLQQLAFGYPEYIAPSLGTLEGSLPFERPHRLRSWITVVPIDKADLGTLSVDLVLRSDSGARFGAVGWIDARPFVANPGYVQPPLAVPYVFEPQDTYRTPSLRRVDLAVRFSRRLGSLVRGQWYARLDILNLFNKTESLDILRDGVVVTALQDPSRFQAFDPVTQTPVRGVHWEFDSQLGSTAPLLTSLSRSVRWVMGVRF